MTRYKYGKTDYVGKLWIVVLRKANMIFFIYHKHYNKKNFLF